MELEELSPTGFENLIFDLVCDLGLVNTKWRTPGSDEGRDIEGEYYISDLSGFFQKQVWYVECKRYTNSVSWPLIWEKIAYAETHDADVLLIANTSSISPQAQNQVTKWNESGKKPTIRIWNKVDITEKLSVRKYISIKYGLSKSSLQDVIDSIIPLTKILIKINDSLYSSDIGSEQYKNKMRLSHSLGELLDRRICNIEKYGRSIWKFVDKNIDVYEWISISIPEKLESLDSSSFRAFVSYLKFSYKLNYLKIDVNDESFIINLPSELEGYKLNHLRVISQWSNFQFVCESNKLIIQGV